MHGYVLPHVSLLDLLFKGCAATGEDVYVPSAIPIDSTGDKDDHMSMEEDVNIPSDKGAKYITIESEINSKSSQS